VGDVLALKASTSAMPERAADATPVDAGLLEHVSVLLTRSAKSASGARTALPMGVAPEDVREQARDDLEKTQVDRLLALADVVGSKYFSSVPTLSFVDFGCLMGVDFC